MVTNLSFGRFRTGVQQESTRTILDILIVELLKINVLPASILIVVKVLATSVFFEKRGEE